MESPFPLLKRSFKKAHQIRKSGISNAESSLPPTAPDLADETSVSFPINIAVLLVPVQVLAVNL